MDFEAIVERLAGLADTGVSSLPPPAAVLMPVLTGGRDGSPEARRGPAPGVVGRAAAVLVLIHPDADGDGRVVLIERSTHDGRHSGEVSFPGGKADADDVDIVATALREAHEEVALDVAAAGVRVVGMLGAFTIPVSDFHVTPVVALATRAPTLAPEPREVARIMQPPIARFLPEAPIVVLDRMVDGWPLRYGAYDIDGLSVWGATARILSQLGAVLARS